MAKAEIDLSNLEPEFTGLSMSTLPQDDFNAEELITKIDRHRTTSDFAGLWNGEDEAVLPIKSLHPIWRQTDFSKVDTERREEVVVNILSPLLTYGLGPDIEDERVQDVWRGADLVLTDGSAQASKFLGRSLFRLMGAVRCSEKKTMELLPHLRLKPVTRRSQDFSRIALELTRFDRDPLEQTMPDGSLRVSHWKIASHHDDLRGVRVETAVEEIGKEDLSSRYLSRAEVSIPTARLHKDDVYLLSDVPPDGIVPSDVVVWSVKDGQPKGTWFDTEDDSVARALGLPAA